MKLMPGNSLALYNMDPVMYHFLEIQLHHDGDLLSMSGRQEKDRSLSFIHNSARCETWNLLFTACIEPAFRLCSSTAFMVSV